MGDPFIFIEDKYEAKKEMTKVNLGYFIWIIGRSRPPLILHAFNISLSLDTEGQGVYYGDKGCVEYTRKILELEAITASLHSMKSMAARFPAGFPNIAGIRFS